MKKKIVSLALVVALIAIAAMGTLAYFTDTDDATNTFTTGDVAIDLTEAVVEPDEKGNLVATNERQDVLENEEESYDYGKLYPGQTIDKDPTIEVLGSEDTYVAAKIIVTDGEGDLTKIMGLEDGLLNIQTVVYGGLVKENDTLKEYNGLVPVFGDDTYSVYQQVEGDGIYVFYVYIEDPMSTGDTVTIFEQLRIPAEWDNEEMAEMKDLTIKVEAYGTQSFGFDSCFEAMNAAFPGAFFGAQA